MEPLPTGPYLRHLRELLIDWRDALRCPAALSAATALTRLVLNNHLALRPAQPQGHAPLPASATAVLSAEASEPLLAALAGLPALRLLQDVVPAGVVAALSPAVAWAMWQLGRRCPRVELGLLEGTYIGWNLGDLPPPPRPLNAGHMDDGSSGSGASSSGGVQGGGSGSSEGSAGDSNGGGGGG